MSRQFLVGSFIEQARVSALLPQTARSSYRAVLLVFFFLTGVVFASWATRIPDIKLALGLSDAALGGILFGAPFGELVAIVPSAWLIGRIHTRRTLLLSMTLLPICLVLLSLAPGRWQLFAALFCFGFVYNMNNIALNAQAVGVEVLYRRSIIATFHGMWSLGGVVGGIIGAFVAPMGISVQAHFISILILCLVIVAALQKAVMPREVRFGRPQTTGRQKLKFTPFLFVLGFIALGSMATEGAMYDWSAVYFAQVVRPGEEYIRFGYLSCMTCMVCGRLLADRLVNRFGAAPVLQGSGLFIACGMTLALTQPTLLPAMAGLGMVGFGMASIVPLCYSLAGRSKDNPAQVGISFVSSISFFGFLACPPMVGFLSHLFDLSWALSPIILVGAAVFLLSRLLMRLHGE